MLEQEAQEWAHVVDTTSVWLDEVKHARKEAKRKRRECMYAFPQDAQM